MKITDMDKKELRKRMIQKRNQLSENEVYGLSDKICRQLVKSELFQKCSHICIYRSFRNEVSCDGICQEAFSGQKHVYVPVTDLESKTIDFYEIFPDTLWKEGAYGIMEPCLTKENKRLDRTALICMPGLIFDKEKHRIGYGGGYYDKYLQTHASHKTVALCYGFQIVGQLPYDEHEIPPDYIITENGIIG